MVRFLNAVSRGVGLVEGGLCRLLVAALPVMILINVFTRAAGVPIYWMDELAVYTMVWFAMIGLSLTLHNRDAVAVTLLRDAVPAGARWAFGMLIDILVLAFALALLLLSWMWFDPVGLWRAGFEIDEYSVATFNYIYQEPTATLDVPKFLFWLIIPAVAMAATTHAVANLVNTVLRRPGWMEEAPGGADDAATVETNA